MNGLMPVTTTATELQRNYRRVARRVKKTKDAVTVLSNNKPDLVLMDYNFFKNLQRTAGILESKKNKKGNEGLEALFGSWTEKEAEEFNMVVDEMCEKIDPEMWK